MHNYISLSFTINSKEDFIADILTNELAEAGFDTFEQTPFGFKAYILSDMFNEDNINDKLSPFKELYEFSFTIENIPYKNWNEVWESNFQPVIIAEQIYIHADFHKLRNEYPFHILMQPKMAFGTGHHETTFQMAEQMLLLDIMNKSVLDMGSGTGLLAILASMKGAREVLAVDNDPVAAESSKENLGLNNIINAEVICGDASDLKGRSFDIILANINRNILLHDMKQYSESLMPGGVILFSGFYTEDLEAIRSEAKRNAMLYIRHNDKNNWVVAEFKKESI